MSTRIRISTLDRRYAKFQRRLKPQMRCKDLNQLNSLLQSKNKSILFAALLLKNQSALKNIGRQFGISDSNCSAILQKLRLTWQKISNCPSSSSKLLKISRSPSPQSSVKHNLDRKRLPFSVLGLQ